jgi:hypothetical protein
MYTDSNNNCCEGMYTGFHLPPVSAVYDVFRRNFVSFSEGVRTEQFSIWTPDLDDPPFPRAASERVETRGK